mmetsp:Transcript_41882/g.98179  ORF Transcript_41882/g.98179 Transcript_41882/m.98179 type:complete len:346 (-) Transcript_41882:61-1098(-)
MAASLDSPWEAAREARRGGSSCTSGRDRPPDALRTAPPGRTLPVRGSGSASPTDPGLGEAPLLWQLCLDRGVAGLDLSGLESAGEAAARGPRRCKGDSLPCLRGTCAAAWRCSASADSPEASRRRHGDDGVAFAVAFDGKGGALLRSGMPCRLDASGRKVATVVVLSAIIASVNMTSANLLLAAASRSNFSPDGRIAINSPSSPRMATVAGAHSHELRSECSAAFGVAAFAKFSLPALPWSIFASQLSFRRSRGSCLAFKAGLLLTRTAAPVGGRMSWGSARAAMGDKGDRSALTMAWPPAAMQRPRSCKLPLGEAASADGRFFGLGAPLALAKVAILGRRFPVL